MTKDKKVEVNEVEEKVEANEVVKQEKEVAAPITEGPLDFLSDLGYSEEELEMLTGMDNLQTSDITIPYATLISKDTDKSSPYDKGDLVLPDGKIIKGWEENEVIEGITILNIQPVRIMFPEKFNPSNSYVCRSIDGVHGAADGEYAGRLCENCEFSKYPSDGGASPCRDQRLLLCATSDQVFQLIIGGVGMKVFRNFLTQSLLHSLPKVRNLWLALNLNVSVTAVETDAFGSFPAINFSLNKKKPYNDKDTIVHHLGLLKSYKEFAVEHFESAANQSKVQMAAGSELAEDDGGENTDMF